MDYRQTVAHILAYLHTQQACCEEGTEAYNAYHDILDAVMSDTIIERVVREQLHKDPDDK